MSFNDRDPSCSDCKLELIEKRWTQLLLNWVNKCAFRKTKSNQLDLRSLVEVMKRYKSDMILDQFEKAMLANKDIERFIKYKYPILRLRCLSDEKNFARKTYIMMSMLLYHCCTNSQTGIVYRDICSKLRNQEQELILRFCENLNDMEGTVNNVDGAIREAFGYVNMKSTCQASSTQLLKDEKKTDDECTTSDSAPINESDTTGYTSDTGAQSPKLKFKSSVSVLPSVVTDISSYSNSASSEFPFRAVELIDLNEDADLAIYNVKNLPAKENGPNVQLDSSKQRRCQPGCACVRCSGSGPCCGEPGKSMDECVQDSNKYKINLSRWSKQSIRWWPYPLLGFIVAGLVVALVIVQRKNTTALKIVKRRLNDETYSMLAPNIWQCKKNFCQKVYHPTNSNLLFTSLSRCSLLCMGPQLWPYPIGYTLFNKQIVDLSTSKLEYKFQLIPSDLVHQYLAEAFKLFIGDLARLEITNRVQRNVTDLKIKKMKIIIDVDSDPDPRVRYNTDESYTVKVETVANQVIIKIASPSFSGARHGLETLSQLILLDQSTGFLITLSDSLVADTPSYKYRGLMIDTAGHYIPVQDLMRTVDAMAMVKLNTLHWRISDAASFLLYLPELPRPSEYGALDRTMIYTKQDVMTIVHRAGIRGIRVVIEMAAPRPLDRPWSWSADVSCPNKTDNFSCDNILCLRHNMRDSVFDILQNIYTQIIDLTKVDDIFHLGDGLFSLTNCNIHIDDREGYLDKALDRLRLANKGSLPKLPIIWYTPHLTKDVEAMAWDKYGVQLNEWVQNPGQSLARFRVIHSSKWDLSCQMKKQRCTKYQTWQAMYSWKSWRNIEVFSIEGGEAVLWTDLADSGNLDYTLWPRVSAVAERLWSDVVVNASANALTYARLDALRRRMLLKGVKVQPVWPVYCTFNPTACIKKLKY